MLIVNEGLRLVAGTVVLALASLVQAAPLPTVPAGYQLVAETELAEAVLVEAERHYRRLQDLLAKHYVSQAQVDQAEAAWQAAKAQLAGVRASQGQAATTRGFANVVAPYSGVMSALHVEVGEMAVPGRPLATGFDPDALRATARVPQSRVEAVRVATAAWVELPERVDWLKASRVQLLPATAVVRRSELVAVYVLAADGRPQLRQVRLGATVPGGLVEVRAGVKAGEKVSDVIGHVEDDALLAVTRALAVFLGFA